MILKKYLISATAMTVLATSMAGHSLAQTNLYSQPTEERVATQSGVSIKASDKTIKLDSTFNPKEGVTATDYNGKDITNYIIVTKNNVNVHQVGAYKVGYAVLGSNGKRVDIEVTIKVVSNENEEIKTVIDAKDISIAQGSTFEPLKGIKATDITGVDISQYLLVTKNTVNPKKPGNYEVTYLVLDTQGNRVSKTITVTVTKSSTGGTVTPEQPTKQTVIDAKDISIAKDSTFEPLKGIKAIDITGKDISQYLLVTKNTVNTKVPGNYEVTYLILDTQGNRVSKTITVNVLGESGEIVNSKTEIIAENLTINTGDEFNEKEGVKAIDITGLDITQYLLVTKNTVNTKEPGDYEVTYLVLDTKGNRVSKTIKVTVVGDPILSDEEQAKIVKDMIDTLKDASSIDLSDENKVIEVREAYEKLNEEAKKLVTNLDKLEKVEEKITELKKIENDKKTAKAVEDKIASLDRELVYSDKAFVDSVRKEYESLSTEAKLLVSNLDILEKAEKEIKDIFDKVSKVMQLISDIPEDVTLAHKTQVEEARKAYDALDEKQQKEISGELLSILTSAESKIKELEVVEANPEAKALADKVAELMEKLPLSKDDIAEIEALRPAYEKLSAEGKRLVYLPYIEELEMRAQELNASMAKDVEDMITALKEESLIELADENEVIKVREAYDNLTESAKLLVTNLDKLEKAEEKIKELKALESNADAQALADKIAELMDILPIEKEHIAEIEALRPAYEQLSPEGKKLVHLPFIEELEQRALELNTSMAKEVEDMITALKDESSIELADEDDVIKVREAYDNLTESAKLLVPNLDKLEKAEAKLKEEKDKVIAKEIEEKLATIQDESSIELEHEELLVELRESYNSLGQDAKLLVVSIQKLETAETRLAVLKQAKDIEDKIASLDRDLVYSDKVMIQALRKEYEALNPETKALVKNIHILERVEQEIIDIFDKVSKVIQLISAIPEDVDLSNKAQVEEARKAYDSLDEIQKKEISKELLSILISSELKIKELESKN